MEAPKKAARAYTQSQRMAIGFAVGAGAAVTLSLVFNRVYMYGGELTFGGLISRLLYGAAFRGPLAELFSPRFLQALQGHAGAIQGVFLLLLLALLLLPMLFSYFGGRFGIRAMAGIVLGYLLLCVVGVVPQLAVGVGMIPLLSAAAAVWGVRRGKDEFASLAVCCGSLLVAVFLAFGLLSLFFGRNVVTLFAVDLSQMLGDFLSMLTQVVELPNVYLSYYTPQEGEQFFRTLFLLLFLSAALVTGMMDFLLAREGAKREDALAVTPALFTSWRLPNSFVIGMLALCLSGELGRHMGLPYFGMVLNCFFVIIGFAIFVQGVATLFFVAVHMRSAWPVLVVIMLSLRSGPSIVMIVGLFEQFFNMRTRLQIMALASYLAARDRRFNRRRGRGQDAGGEDVGELMNKMNDMKPQDLADFRRKLEQEEKDEAEREKKDDQGK